MCLSAFGLSAQSQKNRTKLDSLLKVAQSADADTQQVKVLLTISSIYRKFNFDSSLIFAYKAQDMAKKIEFQRGYAGSYTRIANVYSSRSKYDTAQLNYQKALAIYEEQNDSLNMSRTMNNIGLMLRYMDLHTESLDYFFKSLEIKKKIKAPAKSLGAAYQNIGITFAIMLEHESAAKYMEQGVQTFLQDGDSSNYYNSLLNVSALYREMGDYKKTIDTLNKAYKYIQRKGPKNWLGNCLYNLGISQVLYGDTVQALSSFNQAYKLYREMGIVQRQIACTHRLARVHEELGNLDSALLYAKSGLQLDTAALTAFQNQTLNEILADVYEAKGNFKLAIKHHKIAAHVRDSVAKEESRLKIVTLQEKFENESAQRELAELSAKTEAAERQARRKEFVNYILWGLVAVILIIAIMLYRLNVNKQMVNATLQEKNEIVEHSLREKDVLMREIHHRVQNNLQFVSSLLNMQSRQVTDEQTLEILKSCKQRIQSMALIHQKLYQEDSLKGIRIENYVQNLVESLQTSYSVDQSKIKTQLDVEPLEIDINSAISLGLILSELITNSYKYAFPDESEGEIRISLQQNGQDLLTLVSDNGVGIPDQYWDKESSSFGLKLVKSLAKKLKAELDFSSVQGTQVELKMVNFFKAQ